MSEVYEQRSRNIGEDFLEWGRALKQDFDFKIPKRTAFWLKIILIASFVILVLAAYPTLFSVNAEIRNGSTTIMPKDEILISFSQPMLRSSVEKNLKIYPEVAGRWEWGEFGQNLKFVPQDSFKPNSVYQIEIDNAWSVLGTKNDVALNFSTVRTPRVLSITPKKGSQNISPESPIAIKMSSLNEHVYYDFKINPVTDFYVKINLNQKIYQIFPKKTWKQNSKYKISVIERLYRDEGYKEVKEVIKFSTLPPLKVTEITPPDGSMVSTHQEISFSFDREVDRGSAEKNFLIKPPAQGAFKWHTDKKFSFFPFGLEKNTKYEVKLKKETKAKDAGHLKTDEEVTFTTKEDEGRIPAAEPPGEAAIKEGRYIDIDISSQTLSIFENGELRGAYPVSTGKVSMPTPYGTFRVMNKNLRAYSSRYGLYMPFWMQFTGVGHGIHELPEWPGGYKEGQNHLGIRVSHGCVRLGVGPAEIVYNFASVGTPVVVHE